MIPRTKVNYNLGHLLRALFVTEDGKNYKEHLIGLLRNYLQEENILLMPSGRAGLYYILKAIDAPRVLIPAYTCKAVAEAALLAGKEVTYIEVEEDGFNMSVAALETVLDEHSTVIATHQFGMPCQIEKLLEICRERQTLVIEDAAASLGSRVKGKLTGTFGDAAFYSFDSTKLINVPMKGGFINVKNTDLFKKINRVYVEEIQSMSWLEKFILLSKGTLLVFLENPLLYKIFHTLFFDFRGKFTEDTPHININKSYYYCYEMANWQAYIASVQIFEIENIIKLRQSQYSEYITKLYNCLAFQLPPKDEEGEWACIRFPIRVRTDKLSYYRRAVERGIDFAFSFTFIPCPDSFRKARLLANSVLDIPFYAKLSERELNCVVSVLKEIDNEVCYGNQRHQSDVTQPKE